MTLQEQIEQYRNLLQRSADSLQYYCEEVNGDMNDGLAMEIYKVLENKP